MEPVSIAMIGVAIFGAVTAISVFIRQLLLSRDKRLNDKAQRQALSQEVAELREMRKQMESNRRFKAHYLVLNENKDAIRYLDLEIEKILNKKSSLIDRYAEITVNESSAIIEKGQLADRKAFCDHLREEIAQEINSYDNELRQLQKRRASQWSAHSDVQKHLLAQEEFRNVQLDKLYESHTALLEKIYLSHAENTEHFAEKSLEAGTASFKMLAAPLQFLLKFFKPLQGVSRDRVEIERAARIDVANTEADINYLPGTASDSDTLSEEPVLDLT